MQTILCPVDLSDVAEREIRLAADLCNRLGARMMIQHCIQGQPPPGLAVSWMFAEEHERERSKEAALTREAFSALFARLPPNVRAEGMVAYGPLDRVVLEVASELPADLIVMATHGRSTVEHQSLTERIIVDASCPVLTTREQGAEALLPEISADTPVPTLVPVNFDEHSRRALEYAAALSRRLPLDVHVLYVAERGGVNRKEVERTLRAVLPDDLALRVPIGITDGAPVEEILCHEAEIGARLVIMGTHHKGWIERLFARSTAREVLHTSPCPVWYVPDGARMPG